MLTNLALVRPERSGVFVGHQAGRCYGYRQCAAPYSERRSLDGRRNHETQADD